MCKEDGESINHLFLHCKVANELWKLVFSMFAIWWVMPCHVVDLLACWSGYTCRTRSAAIWGVIPHCIMWVIWIKACVSMVRFSVIVYKSPTGFFDSTRGLRQSDPLSSLLFLLLMEVLSRMLHRTYEEEGFIRGFHAGRAVDNGLCFSPLFFVDDTILFYNANHEQLLYILMVLTCFEAVTNLCECIKARWCQ